MTSGWSMKLMKPGVSDGLLWCWEVARRTGLSLPNTCYIVRNGARIQAKTHRLHQLKAGDHVVKDTGGGGGVGRPEEKDPQAVRNDVFINELMTIEAAREVYKVVIDPARRQIDWDKTRSLRASLSQA